MKISYNWLKWYIPQILEAEKLSDVITHHLTEVEGTETLVNGDVIFDINILPNRAHDLLSHQGFAKELAGQLGIAFVDPTQKYVVPETVPTTLSVDFADPACRRYMARVVRNVKVEASPEWVVEHLTAIGQRSINNIVDATNIVMFDSGNPCHAFDAREVHGGVRIMRAKAGETLELLGSEKITATLKETDLVIADNNGRTLALAGIKGGLNSGIIGVEAMSSEKVLGSLSPTAQPDHSQNSIASTPTTDIVLEVANFDSQTVRKTARRIGVLSDAAKRFENDVSPEHAAYAMRELSALIKEMCPDAVFEEIVDTYPNPQEVWSVSFTTALVNKKLGAAISSEEIETILKHYSFDYVRERELFTVTPPALRLDLKTPIDMVEEIGRVYGYDKITPQIPKIDFAPKAHDVYEQMNAARADLLAQGYNEVMTYTFTKKGKVEVARGPKGKEFLRTNLSDGLKESYELNRLNAPVLGLDAIKIFEVGAVFPEKDKEEIHVAYADKKGVTEKTLKEYVASFTRTDEIVITQAKNIPFKSWSLFPFITRDVAFWISENTTKETIEAELQKILSSLVVKGPTLVDSFSKDGRTSLAYRFVFQSYEKTLTDIDVSGEMEKMLVVLKNLNCEIR